jgi:hypothetical protein
MVLCHNSMTHPNVVEGGTTSIWRIIATILNKQSWTYEKEWSSSWGVRQGGNNFSSYKHTMFWTNDKGFWLWLYLWYILLSRLTWFWCNSSTLIIYSAFVKYFRKNGNSVRQCVIYLWTSRKPMTQLGGRSWYNILTELGIPNKLVRLIKCV